MGKPASEQGEEPDGYRWSCYKVDRRLDPYMGEVVNPFGRVFTGLSATMGRARSWVRETIEKDRANPLKPIDG